MLLTLALLCLAAVVANRFTGFRSQSLADYAGQVPQFDPRRQLNGPILCEGVIYGPWGRVTSRFVAEMHGTWDGPSATLTERFRYATGTIQNRAWNLTIADDGAIRATADDLIGPARGRTAGPACQMRYRIRLPAASGGHVLDVIDWMYLMPNGTILNRSQFRKFGFKVAELIATMRPATAATLAPDHPAAR